MNTRRRTKGKRVHERYTVKEVPARLRQGEFLQRRLADVVLEAGAAVAGGQLGQQVVLALMNAAQLHLWCGRLQDRLGEA